MNATTTYYITVYDSNGDSDYELHDDHALALKLANEWATSDWLTAANAANPGTFTVTVYRQEFPTDVWNTVEDWCWWDHNDGAVVLNEVVR